MSRRAWKGAALAAAVVAAALTATLVPAEHGGRLPAGMIWMAVSAALLRKATSPRIGRA